MKWILLSMYFSLQMHLNILQKKKSVVQPSKATSQNVINGAEECFDALSQLRTQMANENNLQNPETIIGNIFCFFYQNF